MRILYILTTIILLTISQYSQAQCPPPGFPEPGNTCQTAPVLCDNIDGYCATINNNNTAQNFPGCNGWQLNNDEWFAFVAGTTQISIQVTPSNCQNSSNQGLQAGIYDNCTSQPMDLQCACTENPFILESSNFVVGETYYFVVDGCGGNVCDYTIDVLSGSTVPPAPGPPGPVTGPIKVCTGSQTTYTTPSVSGATIYTWTLNPQLGTLANGTGTSKTVTWTTPGFTQLCVKAGNSCQQNPNQSCLTIEVIERPTATISGSGVLCQGQNTTVNLTVTFTGEGPWTFVYRRNGTNQAPITTSQNPYTLTVNQTGTYTLFSVSSGAASPCNGTVSGSATVTQTNLNLSASTTSAECGNSNGAVNLTVSNGKQPYTYNWSNSATTEDLSNVPPGSYTVTVTDADGCSKTLTATVNNNLVTLNVTGTVVNNTTCTGGNGSIDITVNPSTGSPTYAWSNSETTQDISNLPAGTYTVTVTRGVNCTATAQFTVNNNPNEPAVTLTPTQSTCNLENGSINAAVSGGVAPYTYEWSNSATTEDLSNVAAGTYTITVTGANGCTKTAQATINNNNPPIDVTGVVVNNTQCVGGNGSINITVNPPASFYTYNWSPNGETTEDLSNLEAGTYVVTVNGQGSCTATASFTVNLNPNQPNVSGTVTNTTCELENGGINVSVTGGVAPYTYEWDPAATTEDLTNIPAGTYSLTVTGANGCTRTISFTVNNSNPVINVTGTVVNNTQCVGGNGSINVTVNPPANFYTFVWSPNGETTEDLSNLEAGTYVVTVNGQGACTATASFTVNLNPNQPNVSGNVTNTTCDLSNGAINVNVSGGVAPYTYEWDPAATTEDLSNIPAGSYSLTVTGANGCTRTITFNVNNNNPPINISGNVINNTSCNSGNGSINITVNPPGTYTYTWDPGGQTTEDINNLEAGTYNVTVQGQGSCSQTASFTVNLNPNIPNVSGSVTNTTCDLSNGAINVTVSGGVAPYTFEWDPPASTEDLNQIPAGTYNLTVTGANGCTRETSFTVNNNNPPINLTATVQNNTSCNSGNGSINLTVNPPGNFYTFLWSPGGQVTEDINNLEPGTYSVVVTGQGSCTNEASFTVNDVPNLPSVTGVVTNTTCELSNGSINVTVSGGVTPYTYQWDPPATTQDLNNITAGTYNITVTGANGCTQENSFTVDNNNPPININSNIQANTRCTGGNGSIDITPIPPSNTYTYSWSNNATTQDINNLLPGVYTVTVQGAGACNAVAEFEVPDNPIFPNLDFTAVSAKCGLNNGSINLTVTGGIPPYTYIWTNNATTQDLSNVGAGFFDVTVTSINGCTATGGIEVPAEDIFTDVSAEITNQTSCLVNNGRIVLTTTPGNATVIWNTGANTKTLNNLAPGIYTVTVSAGGTCTTVAEYEVLDEKEFPDPVITVNNAFCGLANGSASVEVSLGVQPWRYRWSNNLTTQTINNLVAGNYAVTVTSALGCTGVALVEVPNDDLPLEVLGLTEDNTSCTLANGQITIEVVPGSNPYKYKWSNGRTTKDIFNLVAGTYTVTVTLGTTCSVEASFNIDFKPDPPVVAVTTTTATCGLANGSATANPSGGQSPYQYKWSNNATTKTANNLAAGIYTVTVTGSNSCTATATVTVISNNIVLTPTATPKENTSCTQVNGAIDLSVAPTGNAYVYKWSNNAATEDINGLAAGTYTVTVTLGNACSATISAVIVNNTPNPDIEPKVTSAICTQPNGAIDLTVSGGGSPYTYVWDPAGTTEDLVNILPGNYKVTVTAANGCTSTAQINVPNNSNLFTLNGSVTAHENCVTPDGAIDLVVTPAGPYTYQWSTNATTQDVSGLPAGTYTVFVTAVGTCVADISFVIPDQRVYPTANQVVVADICDLKKGEVNLTASGGLPPLSFNWSNAEKTEDLKNIGAGTYTVTVTGAKGCSVTASATVPNNNVAIALASNLTSATSCTVNNGAIDLSVTPADPGNGLTYSYNWSNAGNTQDLANIASGLYTVTVSAGGSCTNSATYEVENTALSPSVSGSLSNALCGQSSGSINVNASGTFTPFTYKWSNAQTSEDLTALKAGVYTVTVTGSNSCTETASFTVADDVIIPDVSGLETPNTLCVNKNGAVNISVNPPSLSYTFEWSNSAKTQNIKDLTPGQYIVTVNGGGACISVDTFNVINSTVEPLIVEAITAPLCARSDGSIDISVSNGLTPYTFKWNTGPVSEDLTLIPQGTYTVTVTDANGCSSTKAFSLKDDVITPAITGQTTPNTLCVNKNGAVSVDVTPKTLTYTYNWSNSEKTAQIINLTPGTYTVTVSGGGACTNTAEFVVINSTVEPQIAEKITPPLCANSAGAIDITPSAGQTPYTYIWSNNAFSEDIAQIKAGSYTVTVTDANGCSNTKSFAVVDDVFTPNINGTPTPKTSCTNNDGKIEISVTPSFSYTYNWNNGEKTPVITALALGTYTVTVSGGGACTNTAQFEITDGTGAVTLSSVKTDVLCFGEKAGAIDMTITGGILPFDVKWSPAIQGNQVDLTNLAAGTYTMTITDAKGCTDIETVVINQPASALAISCTATQKVTVPGANDGAAAVDIAGGTAPYTVAVTPGSIQNNVAAGNLAINNLTTGGYSVVVTDANNCTAACGFNIVLINCDTKVGNMGNAQLLNCGGGCITATYNSLGQFLEPGDILQFILHEGSGSQIVNEVARSTQPTFCFDATKMSYGKTYYISAAAGNNDGNGNVVLGHWCSFVSAGTPVVFREKPVASIATPNPITCKDLTVQVIASSDLAGSTFKWTTTNGKIEGTDNQANISVSKAGLYTVIVTTNGCLDTSATTVKDIRNKPVASITASPDDILDCKIDEILLAGKVEGSSNANAIWLSGGQVYAAGTTVKIEKPGLYEFVILDTLSFCSDTANITIGENKGYPAVTVDPPAKLSCKEKTVTLTGSTPFPNIVFQWAKVNGTDTVNINGSTGKTLSVTTPGIYVFIGTDPNNGCSNAYGVEVKTDESLPIADAGPDFELFCYGEKGTLDGSKSAGTSQLAYQWSTNNGLITSGWTNIKAVAEKPGTYTLVVTVVATGCTATDEVVVDPKDPEAELKVIQAVCFGEKSSFTLEKVKGLEPPVQVSVDGGKKFSTQVVYKEVKAGTYDIILKDKNGCSTTRQAVITEPQKVEIVLDPKVLIRMGDSTLLQAEVNLSPSEIKSIQWTPSEGLSCDTCLSTWAKPLRTNYYDIVVTSLEGCKDLAQINVAVDVEPDIYVPTIFKPGAGNVNGNFTIFANDVNVLQINSLQVFSRWGEMVFQRENFEPNKPELGWDGRHNGQDMFPAVFAWYAVIELINGQKVIYKGDITLYR